jgi:Leucine-rich repeat (LRR) protein
MPKDFANLEILNLGYNAVTVDSIRSLYACTKLKSLDLSSNHLDQLPIDFKHLQFLETLNLSGNMFDSQSQVFNPSQIFKALGSLSRLKHLNISRNKFNKLHCETLAPN